MRIYPFGVNRSRLESQIRSLGLPATVVSEQRQADVVLTVRNYYRRKPQALRDADHAEAAIREITANSAGSTVEWIRGDLLSQSRSYGGVGLGTIYTSIGFLTVIVALVAWVTLEGERTGKADPVR